MNPDKVLRSCVEAELNWLPGIAAADIGVAAHKGVVTLTGHVSTYAQWVMVEDAVRRIRGVRGLALEIEVRPSGNVGDHDDEVAGRVVAMPHEAIKVAVCNGHVTLSGEVDWQSQRQAAEQGVRGLAGVRSLLNEISVRPHAQPKDIKRRIEAAIGRQADVDADRILVTVEGGKVRLEGKVRAWHEREAAERAAWGAPGVQTVDDRITIGL